MSNASEEYHREKKARSLDLIKVYNPTSQDFTDWDDKFGPGRMKYMVPSKDKDTGLGKGMAHLPRYLAERYTRTMIEALITAIADKDWEKKKKEYRTLDETILHADKVAIRTNDAKLWKELAPKIWIGLVEKFGGDAIPDPVEQIIPDTGDPMEDAMKDLGLADKVYEPTTETV